MMQSEHGTDTWPPVSFAGKAPRDIFVLSLCQALFTMALSVDLTLTGVAGYALATDKSLATLPFSLITVAAACTTLGASFVMSRIGRRRGFLIGASAGMCGGMISVEALVHRSFPAFCVGTALVGIFQAFAQYYRLAAADCVEGAAKQRAISAVLAGGVFAALAGPQLAKSSMNALGGDPYAGAYLLVAVLSLCSCVLLAFVFKDTPSRSTDHGPAASTAPRSLRVIVRQPIYVAAITNNAVGYAVMMGLMTAAPIAALRCGYGVADGAGIIQWHMVGMFAPSLIASALMRRVGVGAVISCGIALAGFAASLLICSQALASFYVALGAMGVGWNFMFVGGTTLLAQSYRPSERAKAQALSEFTTFCLSAVGSMGAGQILVRLGWRTLNEAIIALLCLNVIATGTYLVSRGTAKTMPARSP